MAKHSLSNEDKVIVAKFDEAYNHVLETITRAQQFKLGDFLILRVSEYGTNNMPIQTNTYGAPVKYRVVYVNDQNIAFVKRTNKKGEPSGRLYSCCGTVDDDYRMTDQKFIFELDPDFADSLLLEDQYDPASLHRSKKDIWNAVTNHNKTCKVPTRELSDIVNFFNTVNVGDMLWTSNVGSFFVQDMKTVSPSDFNKSARNTTRVKGPLVMVLTVKDKNGNVKDITPDFFHWKALYKERPRSYRELNI